MQDINIETKIDKEYLDYCFECKETNTTPEPFPKWLDDYIEIKESTDELERN